jgi:hypothetical protein
VQDDEPAGSRTVCSRWWRGMRASGERRARRRHRVIREESAEPSTDTVTLAQLCRFMKRRNRSSIQTNLQFGRDANACGFAASALGPAQGFVLGGFEGFLWRVPTRDAGVVRLVEFCGLLRIEGAPDAEEIFNLLSKACTPTDL